MKSNFKPLSRAEMKNITGGKVDPAPGCLFQSCVPGPTANCCSGTVCAATQFIVGSQVTVRNVCNYGTV